MWTYRTRLLLCAAAIFSLTCAHCEVSRQRVDVSLRLAFPPPVEHHIPPAVLWLSPIQAPPLLFPPHKRYTLAQQNRTFIPHLLVVPVGSVVIFPNKDPFFHNVFSLFDGKRFDLGLYEAGSAKDVTFSREGVSYIFCNIHPEMSAVVLALSTPLYTIAEANGTFQLSKVPVGDYEMHVWIEGISQPVLDGFTRHVHITSGTGDLGVLHIMSVPQLSAAHRNKFGQPYDREIKPTY